METADELRAKAKRYREMAEGSTDERLQQALVFLAEEYETAAGVLDRDQAT